MRHHPIRPCGTLGPRRRAFRARGCQNRLQRLACCHVLHLTGELDLAATPSLLVAVGRTLDLPPGRDGPRGLVLDLGALSFCDAAGLTGLLRAGRLADAAAVPVSLTEPPGPVARILVLGGLHLAFPLHPTA
ncbi:hypothetical protein DN069_08935 [Streptacidiphilus pinicola]|uniref:STAS domain-containing protein n=1 Tax=Streptacidiphilus pinicola TaxID=2219663 RepID=A0A2X0ILM3_9ACTN|nr:STAS domain-containing protein [Streptacidiphilus pinicola]RAG86014.1 hypothetical protein DN069_08935 [Streptacidiphilus pinicola]